MSEIWKGALAGAAGGIVGAFVLERMMAAKGKRSGGEHDPKLKLVERAVDVPDEQHKLAAEAVHYATGAVSGAIYGAACEVAPLAEAGWGTLFGASVWAALPETMLPIRGLAPPPTKRPLKEQAVNLGEHLVFGAVTETVRRPLMAAMRSAPSAA